MTAKKRRVQKNEENSHRLGKFSRLEKEKKSFSPPRSEQAKRRDLSSFFWQLENGAKGEMREKIIHTGVVVAARQGKYAAIIWNCNLLNASA
jgi:hypothetical protein